MRQAPHRPPQRWRERITGPAVILLAAAAATAPILLHGKYCGDDFEFHAVGWFDVHQSWLHGVLYPHWMASANYGAGEPRFMFYPPLTWMLGAALASVLPWTLVPVAMVFLFFAATGLAVRRLARERLSDAPATLAGCAALSSGFALFSAYERAAFAELTGGFWIPLMLLFALRNEQRRVLNRTTVWLALMLAGAWLSNGPVGVMASYLLAGLAAAMAVLSRSWTPLLRAGIAAALGIGVAAFSLIPAAWEQRWVDLRAAIDLPVFTIENNWLFAHHTGPDLSPYAPVLLRASVIAAAMIGVALAGAAVVFWRAQKTSAREPAHRATGSSTMQWWILLTLIPVAVLLLQTPLSLPLWNLLPKLRFLQYPWRWVLAAEAPMGIFFAAAIWPSHGRSRGLRVGASCLCAALFLGTTALCARTFLRACGEGESMADLLAMVHDGHGVEGTDEYEPPGADHWLIAKDLPDACLSDASDVVLGVKSEESQIADWDRSQGGCVQTFSAMVRGPERMSFHMDVQHGGFLILRLMRYPAWRITVNGHDAGALPERDDGLMAVPVPQGPVDVDVRWVATRDVLAGRITSLLAAAILIWMFLAARRNTAHR